MSSSPKSQNIQKMHARPFVLLAVFVLCLGVFTIRSGPRGSVRAQSDKLEQDKEPSASNNYGFAEVSPFGEWVIRADFDVFQSNDPDVPVVLAGIRTYTGKGAWQKQLMIESVTMNNRTTKLVQGVKLGWIVMKESERNSGKNREAALLDGYTKTFKLEPSSERMRKLKSVLVDSIKLGEAFA